MGRVAVFVDAGYFWVQMTQILHGESKPRDSVIIDYSLMRVKLLDFVSRDLKFSDILRVYWYDGPLSNGSKSDSHTSIEQLDDFKLRLGSRNISGEQKAVDGLLIADLIGLAQNRAITDAIVISGDADLIPGIITAQALGIRVICIEIGPIEATSKYLMAEVDRNVTWFIDKPEFLTKPSVDLIKGETSAALIENEDPVYIMAQTCYSQLSEEEISILKRLNAKEMIPPEIDREILSLARKHKNNALLTFEEKRTLRLHLRTLAVSADAVANGETAIKR